MSPSDSPSENVRVEVEAAWPSPALASVRDAVIAAYLQPQRSYHNLQHLAEVLQAIDAICGSEPDLLDAGAQRVVRLAAFFHDAVYETPSTGDPTQNEARSAQWASGALSGVESASDTAAVAKLVDGTAAHEAGAGDTLAAVLFDADLAILAAPVERYREYVSDVRREYAAIDEESFRTGRASILEAFVARPAIYRTTYGLVHWERPARANLARELGELTAGV